MSKSKELDQFYTNPEYAKTFYDHICQQVNIVDYDIVLEPSAGTGNFYNLFDPSRRIGLDLEPKAAGIIKTDFFDWTPPPNKTIITIGNPPFGKNASLAVKFFNHCATYSDYICFVIPRTFRKASLINRLDKQFHLISDIETPPNSFIFNGKPYDVWCCAQIWKREELIRPRIEIKTMDMFTNWFERVTPEEADFCIQRVGGGAGTIREQDITKFSSQSHYFIKSHHKDVLDIFKGCDFDSVKYNTASNPSVSPGELCDLWEQEAKKYGIEITDADEEVFNSFFV